ncbi:hypothetical protein N8609_02910 [Verrucomicrobia bacterium]|nr:hypothetical protein [Verrucomicrobiota bacterium]
MLSGCSTPTPYQSGDGAFAGGFYDKKINYHEYVVNFNANGFSDQSRAKELAFLRVAELCLRDGFKYFVIYEEQNNVDRSQIVTMSNYVPLPYGGGMMMSNSSPTAKPYSQVSGMGFIKKPITSFEIYNSQDYWDAISVKYNVKKTPLKGNYNSEDGVIELIGLIEKSGLTSLKRYAIDDETVKIIKNKMFGGYSQSICFVPLFENPFIDEKNEGAYIFLTIWIKFEKY